MSRIMFSLIIINDLGFLLNTIQLNFHLFLFLIAESETSMSCVLNENCLLPCRFKDRMTNIEWKLHKTSVVIVSYDHRGSRYSESFRSRASLFEDQISRGNGDLLLRGVKVDDEGTYRCSSSIKGSKYFHSVDLTVEGRTLSFENILLKSHLESFYFVTEEKLYDISSSLTVPDGPDLIYSCSIRTRMNWWRATSTRAGEMLFNSSLNNTGIIMRI
uniref:Ig-like domain-containing protein n=1 Tax=Poecilia reticulata TaxID=8081 RepID=A0A3P9QGL3_POERE